MFFQVFLIQFSKLHMWLSNNCILHWLYKLWGLPTAYMQRRIWEINFTEQECKDKPTLWFFVSVMILFLWQGKAKQFICVVLWAASTQCASQIEIGPTKVKNHNYVKVKSEQHHRKGPGFFYESIFNAVIKLKICLEVAKAVFSFEAPNVYFFFL